MITEIRLRSFKGHRDTSVPLGRFTMLVGPNGTGKTSVLQALELLSKVVNEPPAHVLREEMSPPDLQHRTGHEPVMISAKGVGHSVDEPFLVSVRLSSATGGKEVQVMATWGFEGHPQNKKDQVNEPLRSLWGKEFTHLFGSSVLYHFDARQIASVSFSSEENPVVEYDGSNTAVVLAALKLEREEAFSQVEEELRKIVPSVLRIRVRRVRMPGAGDAQVGNKVFLDFKGAADIPAHAASEGTLVTLALLTVLCSPNRPRVLLLDDIDQSLHPQAQAQLIRELKGLLKRFPEIQIVATTHSPYVLDELDPADVLVFAPEDDGAVACRRLSEHPQAVQVAGMLTAGQLWTLDPESRWVVGAK
jgi:predicted ATPase